jgi:NAD(P)H-hydrate repair Nnr-like enzyme with NAD(P)H-hydrate dehydratase domain
MSWKYFAGACLVVGGALLKAGAPVLAILAGLALAALANFLRYRASTGRNSAVAKAR